MPVSRVRMAACVLKTTTDTSVPVRCVAVHKAETRPPVAWVRCLDFKMNELMFTGSVSYT